jgi:hypothetical protein
MWHEERRNSSPKPNPHTPIDMSVIHFAAAVCLPPELAMHLTLRPLIRQAGSQSARPTASVTARPIARAARLEVVAGGQGARRARKWRRNQQRYAEQRQKQASNEELSSCIRVALTAAVLLATVVVAAVAAVKLLT